MGGTVLEYSADKVFNAGKKEGREEGWKEGREKVKEENTLSGIRRAIKKQKMTLEAAMDYMDIPQEQQPRYAAMLREEAGENSAYASER